MTGPPEPDVLDVYENIFKALGQRVRLQILAMIVATDELACTTLEEVLPISKPTISYHIKTLREAGLIKVRKEGRNYFYRLRPEVVEQFLPGWVEQLADEAVPAPR